MPPPTTTRQDILISIRPQHVGNIASRKKNHEFRSYLIPPTVKRLWIYETSPASCVKYVASISHGKRPGEICDPSGVDNDGFDAGKFKGQCNYAYEILKLQELPRSYSLAELKKQGWLGGPPQKYCFVGASMLKALKSTAWKTLFESAVKTASPSDGQSAPSKLRSASVGNALQRISHSGAIQKPKHGSTSEYNIRTLFKRQAKRHDTALGVVSTK